MNIDNISAALPKLQDCDPDTFFHILGRIDRTPLEKAVAGPAAGPKRRGPKLKEVEAVIPLYLWCRWCQEVRSKNAPNPTTLRRELEDPKSDLAKLCRFDEGKGLPDRKTISNHFRRIEQHPDLVAAVLLEINQWVPPAGLGKQSPKPKKAETAPGSQKGWIPRDRNRENVDQRRRRRKEAVGDEEFKPIIRDESTARDFVGTAVHGVSRKCYICPKWKERGWKCIKDHVHDVVVWVRNKQGQILHSRCHCCGYKLSVTASTTFHGTNFSCTDILRTLRYMVHFRNGVSAQDVAGALNKEGRDVSEGAALMMMHRLRECMWEDEPGGFDGETEVDEMLLSLDDGRLVSIVTLYNRPTRCVRLEIVEREGGKKPKARKRELLRIIRKHTVPGSTILSDGDASMPKPTEMGRNHDSVIHKQFQFLKYSNLGDIFDKVIEVTVNRAEGTHAFLRRTLSIRNGISRHHLERYLAEAVWRINHLHNKLESQNYEGGERRNLSLMRDVLSGATRRKLTLRDLRGKPQKKRDNTLEKNRTAPASAPAEPQQRPLLPPGPIVPGASQSGSGKVEVKPHQTRPTPQSEGGQVEAKLHQTRPTAQSGSGKVEVKPPQTRPMQMVLALWDSQPEDEQPQPVLPEETAVGSQPAESGPLEELERALAA